MSSLNSESFVHFFKVISQFFDIITVFQGVLIICRKNFTKDIFIVSLDFISHSNNFPIHCFKILFDFIFEIGKPHFLCLTFGNVITNPFVTLDVPIRKDSFKFLFMMSMLLVVFSNVNHQVSELLFFMIIVASLLDTGFQ